MTPFLTEGDIEAFPSGVHGRLYRASRCPLIQEGVAGARFAVRAPNAERVHVIGDFFVNRQHLIQPEAP